MTNTGTYVDSPFHRYENGKDLAELPLESVAELNCLVVRVPPRMTSVDEVPLAAAKVKGRAVLFHTSWDRHFRTDAYFEGHPHLTARAAEWLVKPAPRSWELIRSTSTARPRENVRCTPCSAARSPSVSTCVDWRRLTTAGASRPYR